jgi:hypothetical protein
MTRIFYDIFEDGQRMVGPDVERVCTLETDPNRSFSSKLTLTRWTRRRSSRAPKPENRKSKPKAFERGSIPTFCGVERVSGVAASSCSKLARKAPRQISDWICRSLIA